MSRFHERLLAPAPDLCLYGLAPPKLSTEPARLAAIVEAQTARLQALAPDALVIYDLQDESSRQTVARPFPFLPTLPPAIYAHEALRAVSLPKIVYRCVAHDTAASLTQWLSAAAPDGASTPRLTVLVGAPTSQAASALTLSDAYTVARDFTCGPAASWWLGGIAIAERHARRGDEHQRLLQKMAAGCRFFITQAVYDASATKSMLSDYARATREAGLVPAPIIFTFSPCGSAKTLELLKWLGIAFPRWLENELLDAHDILSTSVRLCQDVWRDVLAFAREKRLPVGLNVESISIRKDEVEASAALFAALRADFARA